MALLDRVRLYRMVRDQLITLGLPVVGPRAQEPAGQETAEGEFISPPAYLRLGTVQLRREKRIRNAGDDTDHAEFTISVGIVLSEHAWDGVGDTAPYGGAEAYDAVAQAVIGALHERCLTHESTHQINLDRCDESAAPAVDQFDPRLMMGQITFMGTARRTSGTSVVVAVPPV